MKKSEKTVFFPFDRENYIIMIAGLVVMAIGFLLMTGGGTDDPNVFSTEIFSFRRITLAPVVVLAGFLIELYAILKRPRLVPGAVAKEDTVITRKNK